MKIISVTGTKGKTTITRALSYIIKNSGENVLRVDTDGHYINERRRSTLEDSKKLFMLVPTVCPGKYLWDARKMFPDFTAVFETAIGSSGSAGLGYGLHQVGIFTNILEDHLRSSSRLKKRSDLAKAKRFIFSRIDVGGTVVFNADDKYVCSQIDGVPKFRKPVYFLPAGFNFRHFDVKKHIREGGKAITVKDNRIVIESQKGSEKIIDVNDIEWTFGGEFRPSVYNLMFIIGGLYAYNGGRVTQKNKKFLKEYEMDKFGGRLTMLENKKGVKIMIDYAHEKFSLAEVAKLGRKMARNNLIGIVRLAPDRKDEIIFETGKYIADRYDSFIVYDKIDGVNKKEYKGRKGNFNRKAGEVSKILYDGIISKKNKNDVERILEEEKAVKRASEVAKSGDLVIAI
ncbi:MAG: Mur ligase family protein [Parcubacteria group bacterium]